MLTVWIVLGAGLLLCGFVGCVVPVIPGPILGYCGLLALLPTEKSLSTLVLVFFGALVLAVTVADYVVPAMGAKKFECTRWGTFGCFIGTFVGLFFFPFGIILGPFLGALAGELIARKPLKAAVRGGIGALLGFLSGIFLKLVVCALMTIAFAWKVLY